MKRHAFSKTVACSLAIEQATGHASIIVDYGEEGPDSLVVTISTKLDFVEVKTRDSPGLRILLNTVFAK